MRLRCPNSRCGRQIDVKDSLAGKQVLCPACKHALRIPGQSAASAERQRPAPQPPDRPSRNRPRGTSGARLVVRDIVAILLLAAVGAAAAFYLRTEAYKDEMAVAQRQAQEARDQANATAQLLQEQNQKLEQAGASLAAFQSAQGKSQAELQETKSALVALKQSLKHAERQAREARDEAKTLRARLARTGTPSKEKDDRGTKPATEVAKNDETPPKKEPVPEPKQPARAPGSYAAIDRHALEAPADAEESLEKLAAYLIQPAQDDRDKARAILR